MMFLAKHPPFAHMLCVLELNMYTLCPSLVHQPSVLQWGVHLRDSSLRNVGEGVSTLKKSMRREGWRFEGCSVERISISA